MKTIGPQISRSHRTFAAVLGQVFFSSLAPPLHQRFTHQNTRNSSLYLQKSAVLSYALVLLALSYHGSVVSDCEYRDLDRSCWIYSKTAGVSEISHESTS